MIIISLINDHEILTYLFIIIIKSIEMKNSYRVLLNASLGTEKSFLVVYPQENDL